MDYYNTLGIQKTATADEIKAAYRKLSLKNHPDRGGDSNTFAKINEAYETLNDPQKRAAYDNPRPQMDGVDLSDIFSNAFNFGFNGHRHPSKNPDSITDYFITLQSVFEEQTMQVKGMNGKHYNVKIPAGISNGARFRIPEAGSKKFSDLPPGDLYVRIAIVDPEDWGRDGTNLVTRVQIDALDAMIGVEQTIEHVNGKTLKIKIPAGSNTGTKLRLANLGVPNESGKNGDLYVIVAVTVSPITDPEKIELIKKIKEA